MAIMSLEDALTAVLKDIEAMSADELRAEHDASAQGDIAIALRELCALDCAGLDVSDYPELMADADVAVEASAIAVSTDFYPVSRAELQGVAIPDADAIAVSADLHEHFSFCGNDETFALAA